MQTRTSNNDLTGYRYYYDLSGNIDQRDYRGGASGSEYFTYDNNNRLLTANGPRIGDWSFVYDNRDNISNYTYDGTTTSFQYNGSNRLSKVGNKTVTYDGRYNINNSGYLWSGFNRADQIYQAELIYQDVESGLVYMQQRYYDPMLMRFRSVDPVGVILEDHRYHNRYSYAANNPMRYIDPDGRNITSGIGSFFSELGESIAGAFGFGDGGEWEEVGPAFASGYNMDGGVGGFVLAAGEDVLNLAGGAALGATVRATKSAIALDRVRRGVPKGAPKNRAVYEIEPSSNTGLTTRDGRVLEGGTVKSRTDYIDGVPQRRVDFDHSHGELDRGHVVDIHVNPRNSSQLNTSRARSPEPGEYLSPVLSDPRIQGGVFKP